MSTTLFELRKTQDTGIFAVVYRKEQRRKAVRLLDGSIVEGLLPDQRWELPFPLCEYCEIAAGGVPATTRHACLGLIIGHLPLSGVFYLPSGDVAAVYGAEVVPIDTPASATA